MEPLIKELKTTRVYFIENGFIKTESLLAYIKRFFPELSIAEYQNFDSYYSQRHSKIPKAYNELWYVLYWELPGFSIEKAKERAFEMQSGVVWCMID